MRHVPSVVLVALLVGAAAPFAVSGASPDPGAGGAAILVEDFAFTPAEVEVVAGASVTWTIGADPEQHTVTPADGSAFEDSGQLFTGDTYVVRFDVPGTTDFLCTLHPFMTGTVTVVAAPASPSAGASPSAVGAASVTPSTVAATASATPATVDPIDDGASGSPLVPLVAVVLVGLVAVAMSVAWRRRGA